MDVLVNPEDILGQNRTGKYKRLVVYKISNPEVVYKGPFYIDDGDSAYNNIYYREHALKAWNATHVLYMEGVEKFDRVFPNEVSKQNIYAIIYPNLRGELPHSYSVNTESWAPYNQYNVSTDASNCEKLSKIKNPVGYVNYDLVRSLILMYILNVGDIGPHNIIVCGGQATIIDYEEGRSSKLNDDELFFFFSKPPAKPFRDATSNIILEFFPAIIDELTEIDLSVIDPNYMSADEVTLKRDDAIRRMKLLLSQGGVHTSVSSSKISNTPVLDTKKSTVSKTKHVIIDNPVDDNIVNFTTSDTIGQMVKSYRNTKTSQGYSDSLIKSALQKNIRRGDKVQALACAFELQRFVLIDAYDIVHNMYNRLSIISCEDVSPENLGLQAYLCGWNVLSVRGRNIDWAPNDNQLDVNDPYSYARLASIVQLLCKTKKTRIGSHLWRCYATEMGQNEMIRRGYDIEDVYESIDNMIVYRVKPEPYLRPTDYDIDGGKMAKLAKIIYERLYERDYNAILAINIFRENYIKVNPVVKVAKRRGRIRCDVILWDIYAQFLPEDIIIPIMEMYFHISESKSVDDRKALLAAIAARILFRRETEQDSIPCNMGKVSRLVDLQTIKWNERPENLLSFVDGQVQIEIQPYMRDKHTGKKGDNDSLRKQFVLEGAVVTNQDENYFIPELKEIYEM